MYLAAAGVGRIGIVDFDEVAESNLHRQVLYGSSDVGSSKLEVASRKLEEINPHVEVVLHPVRLDRTNAMEIIGAYDVVADGTDNFATRYLVNDACVLTGTPNAFASIYRFDGQVSVFAAEDGPCYRCLFPEPPPAGSVPSCAEGGVLGVLPGILGTLQAAEAIKLITGIGEPLIGRVLMVDVMSMDFKRLSFGKDVECAVCGERPTVDELVDYEVFCSGIQESGSSGVETAFSDSSESPPHPDTQHSSVFFSPGVPEIDVHELHEMMQGEDDFLLLDVRRAEELTIADIGGQLLPMNELPEKISSVAPDKARKIVMMCRSGARSARAVLWMRGQGYDNVFNLAGGIIAWSQKIDSSVATY